MNYYNVAANLVCVLTKNNRYTQSELKNIVDIHYDEIIKSTNMYTIEQLYDEIYYITTSEVEIDEFIVKNIFKFLIKLDMETSQNKMDNYHYNQVLNNKWNEAIDIFYTFDSFSRYSRGYDSISSLFRHLIFYIKDTPLKVNLEICNHYVNNEYSKITIGYVPYPITEVNFIDTDKGVYLKEREIIIKEDNIYLEKIKKVIKEYKCNIVFGPEMHGSKKLDEEIKKYLNNDCMMIVCPSYHKQIEDLNVNESTLYLKDYKTGKRVTSITSKKYGVVLQGVKEWISDTKHKFNVVHIKGFGKIGIYICKDFLQNDMRSFIDELNLDVILIQSYSGVTTNFQNVIPPLASEKRVLILGNSCTALKEDKKIIYCQIGYYTRTTNTSSSLNNIDVDCCNKDCNKDCAVVIEVEKDLNEHFIVNQVK